MPQQYLAHSHTVYHLFRGHWSPLRYEMPKDSLGTQKHMGIDIQRSKNVTNNIHDEDELLFLSLPPISKGWIREAGDPYGLSKTFCKTLWSSCYKAVVSLGMYYLVFFILPSLTFIFLSSLLLTCECTASEVLIDFLLFCREPRLRKEPQQPLDIWPSSTCIFTLFLL